MTLLLVGVLIFNFGFVVGLVWASLKEEHEVPRSFDPTEQNEFGGR